MTHILVVDDEKDLTDALARELSLEGYATTVAYDGVEAVLTFLQKNIDAVLMDIRMPRLDGIGALEIMKAIKPGVTVIMFTGQAGQGDMLKSTDLGAFTCLLKPVRKDKLLDSMQKALTTKK